MRFMDFCRKTKGSISIMLCILLLPMVTYASMIIDASRLQSAKVAVSGAADLTMNASMSEYEKTLHDIYGMFAMVEAGEDFDVALEAYFKKTIESGLQGTGTDQQTIQAYADVMTDWVLDMVDSDDMETDNLLSMEVEDFESENVHSSALANPAVLERQIIDYMKYRGPVSLVSTVFSKLSFLKNSSAQTAVIENKVKYTEKLSSLQDPCKTAYEAIVGTGDGDSHVNGYNDYAQSVYEKNITSLLEKSKKYYNYVTRCELYYVKTPIEDNVRPYKGGGNVSGVLNTECAESERTWKTAAEIKTEYNNNLSSLSAEQAKTLLDNIHEQIVQIINIDNSEEAWYCDSNIKYSANYDSENEENSIINVLWSSNRENISSIASIMQNWYKLTDIMQNKVNKTDGNDWYIESINYSGEDPNGQLMADLQARYDLQCEIMKPENYKKIVLMKVYIDDFVALADLYSEVWNDYSGDIESNYEDAYTGYKEDAFCTAKVSEKLSSDYYDQNYVGWINSLMSRVDDNSVYHSVGEYYQKKGWEVLNNYYKEVCGASTKIGETVTALGSVLSAIANVETAKEEWQKSIGEVDAGSIKANMQSDLDTTTDGLNKQDVENLKTVAEGFQTVVNSYKEKLETIKFMDIQLLGGNSAPDFILKGYFDSYESDSREIFALAGAIVDEKFTYDTLTNPVFNFIDGYSDNAKTTLDDNEKFFFTLESICNSKGKSELSEEDTKGKDAVNELVEGAGNAKTPDGEDVSKNHEGTDEEKAKLGKILESISDYCDSAKIPLVDSQSTEPDTDSAKNVKIDTDSDDYSSQGDSSAKALENAKNLLEQICNIGETAVNYAYLEEYFTEMFSCDTDRISLVGEGNEFVNLNNCKLNSETEWYGKEVEFILWGEDNLDENITKNYAMIYMIRFALNAIYAFTAPDIQSFALQIATAIAGWTVIGVPIVQAVITIGLALAESGIDIAMLKAGKDVVIYKSATTFVCSPTGLARGAAELLIDAAAETVQNTAADLIDNAIEGMEGTIEENLDKVTDAVNKYVEKQTDSLLSSVKSMFVTPIINKITPILSDVNSSADNLETRVNDAIDEAFATIRTNIETHSDGALKDISLAVYDKIVSNNEGINNLKTTINEYFEKVKDGTNTERIDNVIDTALNNFSQEINDEVKKYTDKLKEDIMAEVHEKGGEAASKLKDIINEKTSAFADDLTNTITTQIEGLTKDENSKDTLGGSGGITLNYKEYCKIFVFLKICVEKEPVNKDAMLNRTAALMEANVQAEEGNEDFKITEAYTLMHINADVKIKTLFPWGIEAEQNEAAASSGYSFSMANMTGDSVTLKYDGINGY